MNGMRGVAQYNYTIIIPPNGWMWECIIGVSLGALHKSWVCSIEFAWIFGDCMGGSALGVVHIMGFAVMLNPYLFLLFGGFSCFSLLHPDKIRIIGHNMEIYSDS